MIDDDTMNDFDLFFSPPFSVSFSLSSKVILTDKVNFHRLISQLARFYFTLDRTAYTPRMHLQFNLFFSPITTLTFPAQPSLSTTRHTAIPHTCRDGEWPCIFAWRRSPSMSIATRCRSGCYILSFNLRVRPAAEHGQWLSCPKPTRKFARVHLSTSLTVIRNLLGNWIFGVPYERSTFWGSPASINPACRPARGTACSYLWWVSKKCPPPRRLCCSRCSRAGTTGSVV